MALKNNKEEYIKIVDISLRNSMVFVEIYENENKRKSFDIEYKQKKELLKNAKTLEERQLAYKDLCDFQKTKQVKQELCSISPLLKTGIDTGKNLKDNIITQGYIALKRTLKYKDTQDI